MAHSQNNVVSGLSRDTADRLTDPGWWPTKGSAARTDYAGSAACAGCHADIAKLQSQTPMFKAASLPSSASILKTHSDLHFEEGSYSYELTRRDTEATLSVKTMSVDKSNTLSLPVALAIGNGEIGQTYLLKRNEFYLESRLSYFPGLPGLDITPGHSPDPPTALEQSLGEPLDLMTVIRCFGCHTTASKISGTFDPHDAAPGIGCEACHGPGAKHIEAEKDGLIKSGKAGATSAAEPLNPRKLSPIDSVDFCGACHRTPVDVAVHMSRHVGIISIRFQPYRLERSLCWGAAGDPRITCIACHDPHKPLVKATASYDSKCLQCHAVGRAASADHAPACTVAEKDCASCHMPKYEIKPAHATFTDHDIRIVRPGSGFRD